MSSQSKSHPGRVLAMLPAMIAFLCMFATLAAAQDQPPPKWELYGGYSFFHPNADVHGQLPGALLPIRRKLDSNPRGVGISATYNFNHWLGLTADASHHWASGITPVCGVCQIADEAAFSNLSVGPKVTFRSRRFSPFLEVLVGDHRLSPNAFHSIHKLGVMAGGGLDINLSKHVALRLIRADYVHSNYRFGAPGVTPETEIRGVRLQAGLNFMFGGGPPPPPPNSSPAASCSADKTMVYAESGDFAVVRADASDSDGDTLTYSWRTTGGAVEGSGSAVRWNSAGTTPGTYAVRARVDDGRGGAADCSVNILVEPRPNRPPTMSCSADRYSVVSGEPAQITATASDPDGDPLTYSWNTNGGRVRGTGASVTLDTSGLVPGQYTVTGRADDGRGGAADCSLRVEVRAPAPPPEVKELETRLALHSIYFPTAQPSAANPQGGLVPSQQEILVTLAEDFKRYLEYRPDARLILSGHADPRGSVAYNKGLTERRVQRTKSSLVARGVSPNHIEVRSFGEEEPLTADQVRQQIAENPDLSPDDRQRLLKNLPVLVLAMSRRVDVTLSATGQESVRRYPFNAKDYLKLIDTKTVKE